MVDMKCSSRKVHRSLLQRDLLLGVPTLGFVLIFCLSAVFLYLFRWWFMAPPIVLLYVLMRYLTSVDPYSIEIMIDFFQQDEVFYP